MRMAKTGVLLVNIGTPAAPTTKDVRNYLNLFLSDKRVIDLPSLIWQPFLKAFILTTRPKRSAKLYKKIWTTDGSPLQSYSLKLSQLLKERLDCPVELGMHYSDPFINDALDKLMRYKIKKLIVLPLYPQYSATTTASSFDKVAAYFKTSRFIPSLYFIHDYAAHPLYIKAIAASIEKELANLPKLPHLLFSFHGIPKRYVMAGDPYPNRCKLTVNKVMESLSKKIDFSIAFQSQFGRTAWLTPATTTVLSDLPRQGTRDISVICPGFAVDCLETLEEIAIQGKEIFLKHQGEKFHYIKALNDSIKQVELLTALCKIEF